MRQAAGMEPNERAEKLLKAAADHSRSSTAAYDELLAQVSARAEAARCLGKLDVGALAAWKRLRCDTPWMARLMSTSDSEVRQQTGLALTAARNEDVDVPTAANAARAALKPLHGMRGGGDALASAVCLAIAPERLAVYDRRARKGLTQVELYLTEGVGRYGRYMCLLEQCRSELAEQGHAWSARQLDLALYYLGGQ